MYDTNEYATQPVTYGRRSNRRTWLAAGGSLAAVLVLVVLIVAACQSRMDRADALAAGAGGATTTASPGSTASPDPDATEGAGESGGGLGGAGEAGNTGNGGGGGNNGGGDQGGDGGEPAEEEEDPEDAAEPASPLSIDVTVNTVTPGGQCFASGTIAVTGGEYPLTVHYQWRRLVVGGGFVGEPVSAVQNHTFSEPGEINVQTANLPENGTNVFLAVTGPISAGSGLVAYDGCSDGPGGITSND
jgi:hypothetical protein